MTTASNLQINGVVESILYVGDLEVAARFYHDVLALEPMRTGPGRFVAFRAGPHSVLLLFKRGETLAPLSLPGGVIPPHDGSGPHHIGFAIAASDYEAWRGRLERCGVAVESEVRWEAGGRSLYFRDPDGHAVELVTPGIWPNY